MNYLNFANRFCAAPLPKSVCADLCATDSQYVGQRSGTNLLTVAEAEEVLKHVIGGAPLVEILTLAWHKVAGQISYHHADDSGKEWGSAKGLKMLLLSLETQIKAYGGERPEGQYLLGPGWRIKWEGHAA